VVHGWLTCSASSQSPPVDYGAASFLNSVSPFRVPLHHQLYDDEPFDDPAQYVILFVVILALHSVITSSPHTRVAAEPDSAGGSRRSDAIVAYLSSDPPRTRAPRFVFSHRINNSGFSDFYWLYLDRRFYITRSPANASAHLSERATERAPAGCGSIAFRRRGWGWLLGYLRGNPLGRDHRRCGAIRSSMSLSTSLAKLVLDISISETVLWMGCVAAASRMVSRLARTAVPAMRCGEN